MSNRNEHTIDISIKPIQYTKQLGKTNFDLLFHAIKHGFWQINIRQMREYKKGSSIHDNHKKSLPMFYVVNYLVHDQGVAEGVPYVNNGLMIFDIDNYDEDSVQASIKWVHKYLGKCLFGMFRSPSGGLKFIIKTNQRSPEPELHKFIYKKLAKSFIKNGLPIKEDELDGKTSNINRGTYVSWDPDCYYNSACQEFPVPSKMETEFREIQKKEITDREIAAQFIADSEFDEKYARNSLRVATANIFNGTAVGSRNHNMYLVSKACFDCGFDIHEAFNQLQEMSIRGIADPDVKDLWKEAGRHYKHWTNNKGQVKHKFFKGSQEAQKELIGKSLDNIFKK